MSSAGPAYHCDPSYLNRLVMNYLVVEGYRDAAVHFERESGTPPRVDPRTIHEVLRPRARAPRARLSSRALSARAPRARSATRSAGGSRRATWRARSSACARARAPPYSTRRDLPLRAPSVAARSIPLPASSFFCARARADEEYSTPKRRARAFPPNALSLS